LLTRAVIEIGCADENKNEVEVFVRDGAGFDISMQTNCSVCFNVCICPKSLKALVSDWLLFSALSTGAK
jgi:hypothetical protein